MRLIVIAASALLLAGCGGEKYPVPASEAFATLAAVGTPSGLYPLPIGVDHIAVNFESVPGDNFVRWHFSHEGDDLATIFAQVKPSGDNASNVTVSYVDGTATDEEGRYKKLRHLLKTHVQQLVVEAVDSKFENRPFSSELRADVTMATASASIGTMMKDVDKSLDAEIARRDEIKREKENSVSLNPSRATEPTMDLSKFDS